MINSRGCKATQISNQIRKSNLSKEELSYLMWACWWELEGDDSHFTEICGKKVVSATPSSTVVDEGGSERYIPGTIVLSNPVFVEEPPSFAFSFETRKSISDAFEEAKELMAKSLEHLLEDDCEQEAGVVVNQLGAELVIPKLPFVGTGMIWQDGKIIAIRTPSGKIIPIPSETSKTEEKDD